MSGVFVVLIRFDGAPVTERLRMRYDATAAADGLPPLHWQVEGSCAVGLGPDVSGLGTGPQHVRTERLSVIGNARLDNREELARPGGSQRTDGDAPGLELLARAIDAGGPERIADCLGDFSIVTWDSAAREMHAARDPFGVKQLFHSDHPDHLALSSRAALLADGDAYDRDYILTYLSGAVPEPGRSPYERVHALPPGCILGRRLGTSRLTRYWSASEHVIEDTVNDQQQVDEFRALFSRAVATRLAGPGVTWSQLSGGLDSSSVVSMAQSLLEAGSVSSGVSGTLTIVDTLAQGDEREYTAEVLARHGVPNRELVDDWLWRDDGAPLPLTDEPTLAYPFYARERRMRDIVRDAGGRVLLSGEGADHYLTGSLLFLSDLLKGGRVREAVGVLRDWSATLRTSAWRLGMTYGVMPLTPLAIQRTTAPPLPAWLRASPSEMARLSVRLPAVHERPHAGSRYEAEIAYLLHNVWQVVRAEIVEPAVELRYPFLDRPLVEFALRLSPRLRSRPHARKWVLREAMRGILPEPVRTRTGKGGIDGRLPWSLVHERERISMMLRDPIIAQLGLVDPTRLREAVAAAAQARAGVATGVLAPLSLETWLRARSGRSISTAAAEHVRYRGERSRSLLLPQHLDEEATNGRQTNLQRAGARGPRGRGHRDARPD